MAKISTYGPDGTLTNKDKVLGSSYIRTVNNVDEFETKNFTLEELNGFFSAEGSALTIGLKDNGGIVRETINNTTRLAVDLGASDITGQLANSDLANSSITINGTAISLGGTVTTPNTQLTDAQVRSKISVTGGGASYDSSTGVITLPSQFTLAQNNVTNASVSGQTLTLTRQSASDVTFTPTANDFTNTLKTKLDNIESNATADQTNTEIRDAVEAATDSNTFTDADHTKLDGIAAGAEVNVQANWNETTTTSDAFIQNKPTLFSGDYDDLTNKPTLLQLGTTSTTALAGNTSLLQLGTTSTTALAGNTTTITSAQASAITTNSGKTSFPGFGTTSSTALRGDTTTISSTQAANITTNNAKTSFPGFGTTSGTALEGDTSLFSGDYDDLSNKPTLLQLGTTSTTALAGNTTIPSGNQIIDWTIDQGSTNIHTGNYNNTQLTDAQVRSKISGTGLISYNSTTGVISTTANNYTLPLATSSARGGIKIGYTESGKNYPVELDSEKAYVNVPWTDTVYTLPTASSSTLGGVKVGGNLTIDGDGVLNVGAIALTTVQTAANQTAHLALTAQEGDIVVRTDQNKSYVHNGGTDGDMGDYTLLRTPTDAVLSVTTSDGTFINLTPNSATTGAITVAADLSATGTPSATKFLRGDNTWAVPSYTTETYTQHENISAASSSDNSGRTYIQDITLDSNGHVTGIATATETVVNTDTNTNQLTEWILRDDDNDDKTVAHNKYVKFTSAVGAAGTNVSGAGTTSDPFVIAITSPNDNTTYSVMGSGNSYAAGLVLAGNATHGGAFLRKDGTWQVPPDTDTDTVYTHPSHDGDDIDIDTGALTGATVISDLDINVETDLLGHVVDANATVATRDLTLANLGYTGATDANNYSLPTASSSTLGGIKVGTNLSINGSGVLSSTNTTYTSSDFTHDDLTGFVANEHIDWTADQGATNIHANNYTNTTYSVATSSTLGLVKIGYTESGKNYPVELDGNNKMFVNVPWTDNNTQVTNHITNNADDTATGVYSFTSTGNHKFGSGGNGNIYVGNVISASAADKGFRIHSNNADVYFDYRTDSTGSHFYRQYDGSGGIHTRFEHDITSGVFRASSDIVAYYSFSDIRLKENIKPTNYGLNELLKLNPVEFKWKEKDGKEIGLIAQEVEEIVPEVIKENKRINDDTLYKQVDYEKLVPVLINSIKELNERIKKLEDGSTK